MTPTAKQAVKPSDADQLWAEFVCLEFHDDTGALGRAKSSEDNRINVLMLPEPISPPPQPVHDIIYDPTQTSEIRDRLLRGLWKTV